jgi:heme-degrading monooxygenase HmoA
MSGQGYAAIWEFSVRPGRRTEFERHYGPDGSWARLFRNAPGYEGTELLHDRSDPDRYVTIDRWISSETWQAFRKQHAAQYEALDQECEGLTSREARLGEFGR